MWPEDGSVVVDDWFNLIGGEDTHLHAVLPVVAHRPRFGGSYTTAGMNQLERDPVGQGPVGKVQLDRDQLFARYMHETGARPREFSYVYKVSARYPGRIGRQ